MYIVLLPQLIQLQHRIPSTNTVLFFLYTLGQLGIFRKTPFGGFKSKDVVNYLEKINDEYKVKEDGGEREEEEEEQRLREMFRNVCSRISEFVQELIDFLENLLNEQ